MSVEQYSLIAHDWLNLEFIINDLTQRVVGQELHPTSSPTFGSGTITGNLAVGGDLAITGGLGIGGTLALSGKLTAGSFASPIDVTNTREYGFELHYSGNNYNVTGLRSRARLKTTGTTASAQGALLQAANEDGIDAGVLQGALIEAIGKSDGNAATIAVMRGCLVNTEWGDYDTVTNLKTMHVRTHSRNAAGAGSFGTGYGIYIENEAVGGNGQAYDAGIYFKGTNLSAGNKAFTYGIDFSGATYGTADIKITEGGLIGGSGADLRVTSNNQVIINKTSVTYPFLINSTDSSDQIKLYHDNNDACLKTTDGWFCFGTEESNRTLFLYTEGSNQASGYIFNDTRTGGEAGALMAGTSACIFQYSDTGGFGILRAAKNDIIDHPGATGTYSMWVSTIGRIGIGGLTNPGTLVELAHALPYLTLHNITHENTDGGGESRLIFKREDGAGTETTHAQIEASHDGVVANDQLGKLILSVNTGAALAAVVEIDGGGNTHIGTPGTNETQIEADGTLKFNGTATVWNDLVLPLDSARVPASNAPSWESFVGNLNAYAYGVNDFQEFTAELLHGYKEGSAFTFHIHGALNATTAQEEKVQFEIEYSVADANTTTGIGDVFPDGSGALLTHELVIPDATPDLSNIYITIGVDVAATFAIGATIKGRIRRIAKSAGGNELTGDIFVTQVGIHYEIDTVGSRTELTK